MAHPRCLRPPRARELRCDAPSSRCGLLDGSDVDQMQPRNPRHPVTSRVGTASWADKSLVDSGKFYPPDVTSPEARLRYYASQFPLVEVDSSYYAMPLPATTQQWAERTPDNFV